MENQQLVVARRRNAQKREGQRFLERLCTAAGLTAGDVELLDPAYSVDLEHRVYDRIRRGIKDGSVLRRVGLSMSEALDAWSAWTGAVPVADAEILLAASPDFSVCCRAVLTREHLEALMGFDSETVTVIRAGRDVGFALDFEGEADPGRTYEVDTWQQAE